MPLPCLKVQKQGVSIQVQAAPRAKVSEVVDLSGDRCKIKIKAPPVEGQANAALVEFLARLFRIPKRQVTLERGGSGKLKTFLLAGIAMETAESLLREVAVKKAGGQEKP